MTEFRTKPRMEVAALVCLVALAIAVPVAPAAPVVITVAQDGSGDYTTINDAFFGAPGATAENPVIIRVKPGVYRELAYLQRERRFNHLVGEDAATTIITFDLNANLPGADGRKIGTFRTPTVTIDADDFTAENITFENGAGPVGQALAIRVDGDRVVFRRCRFLGWQDTVFLNRGRHYFEDCTIEGHVDFIFGGATAWFERCRVHARKDGYITAASTPREVRYGFVFRGGRISGEPGVRTYLGRPWRDYGATIFINTEMDDTVEPAGWHHWRPEREKTARYAEAGSTGAGARSGERVPWARQLTAEEAAELTPARVLGGADGWNPEAK